VAGARRRRPVQPGSAPLLTDPGGSIRPGLAIDDGPCNGLRDEVYFLP
jgi:hypothetical protein